MTTDGRWHTEPLNEDPQPPVDDREDDDGQGLHDVLVYADPTDGSDDDGA
jgi:hypothetical protein